MSVIRVGSNAKYADGWGLVFGKAKAAGAKKGTTKSAGKGAAKGARKSAKKVAKKKR